MAVGTLRAVLRAVLDVLFPRICLACRSRGWPFCPACAALVAELTPPACRRCGRPFEHAVMRCADCPPACLSWARSPFLYAGPVRRALIALKFGGVTSADDALGAAMVAALERAPPWAGEAWSAADVAVTWVPLGSGRRRARGFDQAQLLARSVAKRTPWPLRALLRRTVETAPQARRRGRDRQGALRGAFAAAGRVPGRVLLVDDVLTTGRTAGECAQVLLAAGAKEVGVLTAARSLGGPVPARCYNPAGLRPGSVVARETSSR